MILKELIERELEQYLEWPTEDRSHVTTVSAKLFAEHAARLYADHIADARKKVSRPQIREVFLRNGAKIEPDRDDLPDWIYESVFELLEMGAPAEQGEPVAYISHTSEGDILGWERQFDAPGHAPLYTAPQPAEQQPAISDEIPARTTFGGPQRFTTSDQQPAPDVLAYHVHGGHLYAPDDVVFEDDEDYEPLIRLKEYEALQAECEKLRAAMIEAKTYIDHYMYGGSTYREPAAHAIALIDAAMQGDQP